MSMSGGIRWLFAPLLQIYFNIETSISRGAMRQGSFLIAPIRQVVPLGVADPRTDFDTFVILVPAHI